MRLKFLNIKYFSQITDKYRTVIYFAWKGNDPRVQFLSIPVSQVGAGGALKI